ncbi:MAG TPA: DUF2232 domain-containing protein [Christensenellaceae bacterium]|nr:DUF2232 domain-containing protein [Christensenellaceae bacterium]
MIIKVKNIKASLVIALIMLALSSLVVISPFATLQFALFAFIIFPPILLIAAAVGGEITALFGFIVLFISGLIKTDMAFALPLSLFQIPMLVVWIFCLYKKAQYSRAISMVFASYICSVLMLFVYARLINTGFSASNLAQSSIETLDAQPQRDVLLYALTNAGLLSLDALPQGVPIFDDSMAGVVLMPHARKELFSQLLIRLEVLFRALPTTLLTGESIMLANCGTALALHIGRRYDNSLKEGDFQLPGMMSFTKWTLSPTLKKAMGVLFIGFLISLFVPRGKLYTAGKMMYTVLGTLLSIQGLSLVAFFVSNFAKRFYLKLLLMLLLYLIFTNSLAWIGLFDLIFKFRSRRKPSNYNRQEEL